MSDLTAFQKERDEVNVLLICSVEDNAILLCRLEIDGEVRAAFYIQTPVKLEIGILPQS